MKSLFLVLSSWFVVVSVGLAASGKSTPRPVAKPSVRAEAAAPKVEEKISTADIVATLEHMQELNHVVIAELKAAQKEIVDGLQANLKTASVELSQAKAEVPKVQRIIDGQREQIAEDAKKIARYHRLLRIVCTILAGVAAFLVFTMLGEKGVLGWVAMAYPVVRWVAPVVVFAAVFGFTWAYF